MGYITKDRITSAARVVLDAIATTGSAPFSQFYDGTDERHLRLVKEIGLDNDWTSPELLIDIAVEQLSRAGWVKTNDLTTRLADDEFDYEVILTPTGMAAVASGQPLECYDVEV